MSDVTLHSAGGHVLVLGSGSNMLGLMTAHLNIIVVYLQCLVHRDVMCDPCLQVAMYWSLAVGVTYWG